MKMLIRLLLGLSVAACLGFASADLTNTSFVLGPTKFKEGDAIFLEQVLATSANLAVGDKVLVSGHYNLSSRPKATLALFLTQEGSGGGESVSPTQTMEVQQGSGTFELVYEVKRAGTLHLTFYGVADGRPFGGVYFGTTAQMNSVASMTLSDYGK